MSPFHTVEHYHLEWWYLLYSMTLSACGPLCSFWVWTKTVHSTLEHTAPETRGTDPPDRPGPYDPPETNTKEAARGWSVVKVR